MMTGDESLGVIGHIALGVIGALGEGGFIAGAVSGGDYITGINVGTIVVATIGAVVILAVARLFTGSRARV